jgi:hypothetical protein
MFLIGTLWTMLGLCAGLGVLIDHNLIRPVDLRHALFVLLTGFAGVSVRGQDFEWIGWPPLLAAAWMTYLFVHRCALRARERRLLGRAVPHT